MLIPVTLRAKPEDFEGFIIAVVMMGIDSSGFAALLATRRTNKDSSLQRFAELAIRHYLFFVAVSVSLDLSRKLFRIFLSPFGNVASSLVAVLFDPLSVVRKLALTIRLEVLRGFEFAFFRLGILTFRGFLGFGQHIPNCNTQ